MNREIMIHIYIYTLCIKYTTHENLLSSTGNSSQCCGGLNKSETDSNNSKLYHPDSVTEVSPCCGASTLPISMGAERSLTL